MNELLALEKKFKAAREVATLNEALVEYLNDLGISTFSFTYYSYHPNSLNKLKYDFASANYAVWHKHYQEEHYEEVDATMETVYRTCLPTFWDVQTQLKESTSARERQMRLDSIAFGAEKGLSIPIHGPLEDFATFVLVQMHGETCLNQWQTIQYQLFTAGYYYYWYLQQQLLKHQTPVEKYQLNKREIQCLQLIAEQLSVAAIAKRLHITERTVNYHIQRLNKKLGTKNKYQSLAKALQKGLIK